MPKITLQQRLVDALIATGRGTMVPSRSREGRPIARLSDNETCSPNSGKTPDVKEVAVGQADVGHRVLWLPSTLYLDTQDARTQVDDDVVG
jgi:hypothetical protein